MTNSKLIELPKSSSFTQRIKPDKRVPSVEVALENEGNITNTPKYNSWWIFMGVTPRDDYEFMIANPLAMKDLGLSLDEMEDPVFN